MNMNRGDGDYSAADEKRRLRANLRQRWRQQDPATLRRWAEQAADRLAGAAPWKRAGLIFVYLADAQEFPTQPIIERARREQRRVAVPVVLGGGRMDAYLLSDDAPLVEGPFGLPAPDPARSLRVEPHDIDLTVVPALAFDRRGHRLGRGGGYYDRYLARHGLAGPAVGWIPRGFLLDKVPTTAHDLPVDWLVTEICAGPVGARSDA